MHHDTLLFFSHQLRKSLPTKLEILLSFSPMHMDSFFPRTFQNIIPLARVRSYSGLGGIVGISRPSLHMKFSSQLRLLYILYLSNVFLGISTVYASQSCQLFPSQIHLTWSRFQPNSMRQSTTIKVRDRGCNDAILTCGLGWSLRSFQVSTVLFPTYIVWPPIHQTPRTTLHFALSLSFSLVCSSYFRSSMCYQTSRFPKAGPPSLN